MFEKVQEMREYLKGINDGDLEQNNLYAYGAIERTIYDNNYHIHPRTARDLAERHRLAQLEIPSFLFRCSFDWRAKAVDLLLLFSVFSTCFLAPLSYVWGGTWDDASSVPWGRHLLIGDLVTDIIYAGCLAMRLNMSFRHFSRRIEIVARKAIISHWFASTTYWCSWATVMPYLFICHAQAPLVLNVIKVARIGHVMSLPDSLSHHSEKSWFRILRLGLFLVLSSHAVACMLAFVGGYREGLEDLGPEVFETSFNGISVNGWLSAYCMAFVEAICMLTGSMDNPLGEGDNVRKSQFGSLVFVAICVPLGCMVVGLFVSTIIRELTLQAVLEIRHEKRRAFLRRALENLDIPQNLQRRVFSFHNYQQTCHDREALTQLFDKKTLSPPLASALRVYLYRNSVLGSPYFRDKDFNYVLEIIRVLEDQMFLPGDYVVRVGEVGREMFFIARGRLSILIPEHNIALSEARNSATFDVKSKVEGEYFGEVALLQDCVRTASVRSDSYVLLSTLDRREAEEIWKHFPRERALLSRMIQLHAVGMEDSVAKLPEP